MRYELCAESPSCIRVKSVRMKANAAPRVVEIQEEQSSIVYFDKSIMDDLSLLKH